MADATESKHILTSDEAMNALRITSAEDCPNLEMLQNSVDDDIQKSTGHDWTADEPIDPTAKTAAMMMLICLREGKEPPEYYIQVLLKLDAKAKEAADSG